MKALGLKEIENACMGRAVNYKDVAIENISTDSRKIDAGTLFVPLIGERFDGHDFIDDVISKGAAAFISDREIETELPYIIVEDTTKALGDIAKYYRGLFKIPVIGITGSVGKTTTKEMTASVLGEKFNVIKTQGNFNNHIGLPLTIFNIDESTDIAVLEMGMNHRGEIRYLGQIAGINAAVITNAGTSHIGNLGSREGILAAKCEIFENLDPNGIKIINGDCDMLSTLKGREDRAFFYSTKDETADIFAKNIEFRGLEETSFTICLSGREIFVNMKASGIHIVANALAAAKVGEYFGLNDDEIKRGIESFKNPGKRMDIVKTDRYTIINDTYNANPQSVKAGIDVLSKMEGRRVAVLGEMLELGEESGKYHREVGEFAAKAGIDVVVGIGDENVLKLTLGASFGGGGKVFYYKTKEEFYANRKKIFKNGDTVLIKASRGEKFEEIAEMLRKL